MVTKDKALSFIAHKDQELGLSWTGDNDQLAMALVEFTEYAKDTKFMKSIPTDEEGIIDAINRIIHRFYQESGNFYRPISSYTEYEAELMDNEVAEMRAELATLLHMMATVTFKDLGARRATVLARKESAEALAYDTAFQEALNKSWLVDDGDSKVKKQKMSISVADSYARKVYKMDPDYVKEIYECEQIDNTYWVVNKTFEQAKEVMNAMAKRIGKF